MKIGIIGLPNVGKSTLFKALTKIQVDINNYPFCTIEPNVGIVEVPDERVDHLTELSNSAKKIYATVEFVDIAGLVKGASEGEGLGNKFLHNVREVDALAHVVRAFESPDITHVHETVNPARDLEIINTELILADLETAQKRLAAIAKDAKRGDKTAVKKQSLTEHLIELLNQGDGQAVRSWIEELKAKGDDFELIRDLHLLTFKPVLTVFNTHQTAGRPPIEGFSDRFVNLDIKTEEELLELSDEEQIELELKSELSELIKQSYQLLGLMTFLTTGEAETRAWTVPVGSTAPRAGRAIHGDFEQKFIRAEVIAYDDLIRAGGYSQARNQGLLRTEGKDYLVQDGDVIEFKV
jgi:hypothetical protein